MKIKPAIYINSAVLYITAFILTTILHESSHAIAGMILHSGPILHHNYVEHLSDHELTIMSNVFIALAGPIMSLLQGIVTGALFMMSKRKHLTELFLLWLSILGFNNFFGYLMTGPFFTNGDIGKSYLLLNIPFGIQIALALFGITVLTLLAYKVTKPFLMFSNTAEVLKSPRTRKSFAFQIIILPWISGSAIMTLLYFPIIAIVSIIYPIMSGMILICSWQNAKRIDANIQPNHSLTDKISVFSIATLIILIICFEFILAPGIKLY